MASKNVSLDEYLHSKGAYGVERKTFANDDGVIIKGMPSSAIKRVKYDEEKASAAFVMSAEVEDRDRDIVIQAGLDTSNFEANPVALFAHNSTLLIGKWSDLTKTLTGRPKRTEGVLNLSLGIPKADEAAILLKSDTLRACSIGFMPTSIERREIPDDKKDDYYYPGYVIHSAELFECSVCAVPANPSALAKAAKDGDRYALEDLERVMDGWSKQHGLLIPRKAFEDAHRDARPTKSTVVFDGKTFEVKAGEGGAPILAPVEPSEGERIAAAIEKEPSVLARLAQALGLKGKTEAADPKPEEDGPKPAPEPTPEQKLKDVFTKDLPALGALHDRIERRNAAAERHADIEARLSA
jgi:HK97 family phage prohead protease